MKRVKITHKDGRKWQGQFEDPTLWIEQESLNNSWGLPERIIEKIEGIYDPSDVLEEIPEVIENDVVIVPAKVKLKAEYIIEIEDISAELAAIQAKNEARESAKLITKNAKAALNAVKAATNQAELKAATKDLAKVVHALVKALDLVDPTEAE